MDTILWLLAFSLAGYVAGFFLCKRNYSSKVVVSIEHREKERFAVSLARNLMIVTGLDPAVDLVDNYLSLRLLPSHQQKEILALQDILTEKGEQALFEAGTRKGAQVGACWRCKKDQPILHEFCTACAWHQKFRDYYSNEAGT